MSEEPPKPIKNSIAAQFLIGMGMVILFLLITFVFRKPQPSATENNLDFGASVGKSAAAIRDTYRQIPGEELRPAPGDIDLVPAGTLAEGYFSNDYLFYFFYDSRQNAIGFQVFDGLDAKKLTVKDWEKIASLFQLKITHPPDEENNLRVLWKNENGYRIEFTRDAAGEFVSKITVIR
jgi:hypothetical protein